MLEEIIRILNGLHDGEDYMTREDLIDSGVLDSFDIVTLVAELGEAFDITVPAEEIAPENFNSAKALCAMVRRLSGE